MNLAHWRDATREDVEALNRFECTTRPERPSAATGWVAHHDRPWEYKVQSMVRDSRPPVRLPEHLLVGVDANGELVGVVRLRELDGPESVMIVYAAISLNHRHNGSFELTSEMSEAVYTLVESRGLEVDARVIDMFAKVHENNRASQQFCERMRLEHVGEDPDAPELRHYATQVRLDAVEVED